MSYQRESIVNLAASQLGQPYYSMNYAMREGWGGMGTNLIGEGWGCAQLCSMPFNIVLGTRYKGSVWNFAGDALGDKYTNQGGGEFEFVNEPQPCDVVLYLKRGLRDDYCENFRHAALYVGDGMVIGAWGSGKPWESDYFAGRGVSHDTVAEQSLGGGWRYVRCMRLRDVPPRTDVQEGDEMVCLIQPDGKSYMEYFDGTKVHPLATQDEERAIREVYRQTHGGAEIPTFALGTPKDSLGQHLHDLLKR